MIRGSMTLISMVYSTTALAALTRAPTPLAGMSVISVSTACLHGSQLIYR